MKEIRISLRPISKDNWQEAARLQVDPTQENFVASNLYSIAQSKFENERVALCIYNEIDQMVGFVMYNDKPLDDGTYRISRLMICREYQGKGYGKAAIREILERIERLSECHEIIIEVSKANHLVQAMVKDFGFQFYDENEKSFLAKKYI